MDESFILGNHLPLDVGRCCTHACRCIRQEHYIYFSNHASFITTNFKWNGQDTYHYITLQVPLCVNRFWHQLPCVLLLKCDCHILPFNCPHLERGAGLQFWDNLYSHCKKTRFITETLLLFCLIYIGLITVKGTLHMVLIGVQAF